MNNGFLHREVMLPGLIRAFESIGARVEPERVVQTELGRGYIDLWAQWQSFTFAVEVERTPDRISRDVLKATGARVNWLVIVAPTRSVTASIRRHPALQGDHLFSIYVAAYPAVIQWIGEHQFINDRSDCPSVTKSSIARTPS